MAVTLVVIMLNEEKMLPAFLDNIRGVFPNNIFIDGGSTDRSIELVEKAGHEIYQRKFDLDFATQKNFGLDKARTQWRMILDVDEILSLGMKHLFELVNIKMDEDPLTGWSFLRDNYIDGNFMDTFPPDQQIRLISDQIHMVGKVHEKTLPIGGTTMNYRVYDGGRIFHRKTSLRQYRANFIYEMIIRGRTEAPTGIGCFMEGIRGEGGKFRVVIDSTDVYGNLMWNFPWNEEELIKEYGLDTYEL